MNLRLAALMFALAAPPAVAEAACKDIRFEDQPYTTCEVTFGQDLRLFHADTEGVVLGSFGRVDEVLQAEGKKLAFAMNAGMYHPDRAPVGLLITEGQERAGIVTRAGPGNFGLLPNGVFCIGPDGFAVVESRKFKAHPPRCRFATQSGPMLVINGKLHPRFLADSDSRYIRNGVGVSADGKTAYFVISGHSVNFDTFGRLFRDGLSVPNALYFDGKISRLYAPSLGRSDFGFQMGPIVGLAVSQ
ncbi:phosphodiester glycosidase family protein [Pseudorhodobacter sp.]|uniref:phosphodiester glycosidase family protein n=1 Tax=Pseudorhodobacter sp. TaxID=1934400 RepID=UPI00264797D4|nr:phosphodiester glycosidase family protein [Pseudorhodobacter sp.]MDN5787061.1 phosphodiester glycosidase family protein [Pseudorhodobacter sp.]